MLKAFPRPWHCALLVLLLLAAAEGLSRAALPTAKAAYVWPPGRSWNFEPDPRWLPGVQGRAVFRTNALGLRGEELAADARPLLAFVGGSAVECLYLDQREAWPELVGERLRQAGLEVFVTNAGRSGHTSRNHRLVLESLLAQVPRPTQVVLMVGYNDFLRRLANDTAYDPLAFERSELRPQLEYETFLRLPAGRGLLEPAWKSTGLWRLARRARAWVEPKPTRQDYTGRSYVEWRERRASAQRLRAALPDLSSALEEFERHLTAMEAACRQAGVRLLLITHPYLWRADLPQELERTCWMGGVGEYAATPGSEYYAVAALSEGMARYNQRLREFGARHGLFLIDLEPQIPKDAQHFYDDVHFTEVASQRAAEHIAQALLARRDWLD